MYRNFKLVIFANLFASLAGLITASLNARILGIEKFGLFSLILSYTALFSAISTFDIWQQIIRLGMRAPRMLGLTISSGILLDFSAALIACILATLFAMIFGSLTGVPTEHLWLAYLHALSLLGGVAGTPKGFFRLTDRFDLIAGNQIMAALVTTVASLTMWRLEANLATYVVIFALISAAFNLSLFVRMLIALKRSGVRLQLPFTSRRGMWMFRAMFKTGIATSMLSTLNSSRNQLALLLVGSLLGGAAAGSFAIATRFAAAVSKFDSLLAQVLFKTVLQAAGTYEAKEWRNKIFYATLLSFLASSIITLLGIPAGLLTIPFLMGDAYASSAPVFGVLLASECARLAVLHLNPVIQQKAGPLPLLYIAAISLGVHLVVTVSLTPILGVIGAGFASFLSSLLAALMMAATADYILRRAIMR